MRRKDTSIKGFEKIGIKITEEQFDFLSTLNMAFHCEDTKNVPVFHMMVLLRELGLLPKEMLVEPEKQAGLTEYEKKYGAMIGKNDEQEELEKKSCTELWEDYFE